MIAAGGPYTLRGARKVLDEYEKYDEYEEYSERTNSAKWKTDEYDEMCSKKILKAIDIIGARKKKEEEDIGRLKLMLAHPNYMVQMFAEKYLSDLEKGEGYTDLLQSDNESERMGAILEIRKMKFKQAADGLYQLIREGKNQVLAFDALIEIGGDKAEIVLYEMLKLIIRANRKRINYKFKDIKFLITDAIYFSENNKDYKFNVEKYEYIQQTTDVVTRAGYVAGAAYEWCEEKPTWVQRRGIKYFLTEKSQVDSFEYVQVKKNEESLIKAAILVGKKRKKEGKERDLRYEITIAKLGDCKN